MKTMSSSLRTPFLSPRVWASICLTCLLFCGLPVPAARSSPAEIIPGNHYGYTLDEVEWEWVTPDQDTGLNTPGAFAGPFDLGFTFRYYGRAYTQLYVNTDGFISFTDGVANPFYRYNTYLPKYTTPNNIIAPLWTRLKFGGGAGVRYGLGGTAPNRYFAVEWVNLIDEQYSETVWFEALLYENGDIKMQYFMIPTINFYSAGIEDDSGWDGVQISLIPDHGAFTFYYPEPSARPRPLPAYQSAYSQAGQAASFTVEVLNAGDLGSDTFDLSANSTWPVSFFAADGVTPLTDTDSDGVCDTGPLDPGASRTVVAKISIPSGATRGANTIASFVAASSLSPSVKHTAQMHAIVPASFAQVFTDMGDQGMYLELVEPGQRNLVQATPGGTDGYESSVAAQSNGSLVYAWGDGGICFTILDKTGATVRPTGCLTDMSSQPQYTWEAYPAVATTSDGKIGLFWMRQYFNYAASPYTVLANLFFAVLNADGSLAYGPANLTNNTTPTPWNTGGRLYYKNLSLAAVGADRFALAWEKETMPSMNEYINDVYIAVRATSGAQITPATRMTADTSSNLDNSTNPNLATLSNGRALLTWFARGYGFDDVYYAVLDNAGGLVKATTNLTTGDTPLGGYPDAVQLSGGNILVAWPMGMDGVGYALLDGSYNLSGQVHTMTNPYTTDYNEGMSVTSDGYGNGILTWFDFGSSGGRGIQRRPFIYYALVDGSGELLTPTAILRSDRDSLDSSLTGFGVAPYAGSGVDVYVQAPIQPGGSPGESASLAIRVGNQGGGAASQVQLTASLDASLTYLSATPAPTNINGQMLTWELADLPGGAVQSVYLQVSLPGGVELGTLYPVTLSITCSEDDIYEGNNTQTSQVMAAIPSFLPLVQR
ncbi:MAG: DUF11 domain-containing protein [Anaerolineales bacterium]|nr:DUF11 domain-containing protein [Anaerolineales bacterium]